MSRIQLLLLIHSHQPVGNFEHILEQAYQKSYLPFVEQLERHPAVRASLHYSGVLLEWLTQTHPEFFDRLRRLVEQKQVELLGGGFYEPIFPVIPEEDRQRQIRLLPDFLAERFGTRPRGMWLAERVWEPMLPTTLARAGIDYALVDDIHFLAAGLEPEQLYGYYLSEDLGHALRIIPGLKQLRYLIPFHQVTEVLDFLRRVAAARDDALAAMGDDCEKFGVWPGTHEHCYTNRWLDDFFTAIEANSDWLQTTTAADYLDSHPPLGRVYLPTASYSEMMEWALPVEAQEHFERARAVAESSGHPIEMARFLRGGFWRNFLSKYSEANHLHKRMLDVSARLDALERQSVAAPSRQKSLAEARYHLLRAQCNDAYWHGVFGGLYAPHLRTALYRNLIQAEALAAAAESPRDVRVMAHAKGFDAQRAVQSLLATREMDFDVDGAVEREVTGPNFSVIFDPEDGGTVSEIDLRSCGVNIVNSLMRRREPYHKKILAAAHGEGEQEGVCTIHEMSVAKEAGLEKALRYDRYERSCFRGLLFPHWKSFDEFAQLQLEENTELAAAAYLLETQPAAPGQLGLKRRAAIGRGVEVQLEKNFLVEPSERSGVHIRCALKLENLSQDALDFALGLELVANLLAPDAPDRYFEFAGRREVLRWSGEVPGATPVRLVDEWQRLRLELNATRADAWWIAPIETVSQSEAGSEKVYQGSSILPVWRIELAPEASWQAELTFVAEPLA